MITVVNNHNHTPTPNDVYVGRGSVLGNPYTSIPATKNTKAEFYCSTREESLSKYYIYLLDKIKNKDEAICNELNKIWKMAKNGDVNLACFCVPMSCHATIIKNVIQEKLNNIKFAHKTYKGQVIDLEPNQIFVFGSNTEGRHGRGAALTARQKHGAIYGQARGLQGQSYAIVTKDLTKKDHPSRSAEQIKEEIRVLYEVASVYPELEFVIPYNCSSENLNAYSNKEMADFFSAFDIPKNIIFEEEFYKLIKK